MRLGGRAADHREDLAHVATPWARVSSSSLGVGIVAVEVALHQVVVGDHDALDEVVVDLVLPGLHVVGDLAGDGGEPVS